MGGSRGYSSWNLQGKEEQATRNGTCAPGLPITGKAACPENAACWADWKNSLRLRVCGVRMMATDVNPGCAWVPGPKQVPSKHLLNGCGGKEAREEAF